MLSSTFSADTLSIEAKKSYKTSFTMPSFKFTTSSSSSSNSKQVKNNFLRFCSSSYKSIFKPTLKNDSNNSIKSNQSDDSTLIGQMSPNMSSSKSSSGSTFFESSPPSTPKMIVTREILFDYTEEAEWFASEMEKAEKEEELEKLSESQWFSSPLLSQKSSIESLTTNSIQHYLSTQKEQQTQSFDNYNNYSPSSQSFNFSKTNKTIENQKTNKNINNYRNSEYFDSCRLSNVFDFLDNDYLQQFTNNSNETDCETQIVEQEIIKPKQQQINTRLEASRVKAHQTHNIYMAFTNQTSVFDDEILLNALHQNFMETQ